jgi:hypothetical protein
MPTHAGALPLPPLVWTVVPPAVARRWNASPLVALTKNDAWGALAARASPA